MPGVIRDLAAEWCRNALIPTLLKICVCVCPWFAFLLFIRRCSWKQLVCFNCTEQLRYVTLQGMASQQPLHLCSSRPHWACQSSLASPDSSPHCILPSNKTLPPCLLSPQYSRFQAVHSCLSWGSTNSLDPLSSHLLCTAFDNHLTGQFCSSGPSAQSIHRGSPAITVHPAPLFISPAHLPLTCHHGCSSLCSFCLHQQVVSSLRPWAGFAHSLPVILVTCICWAHPPWWAPWKGITSILMKTWRPTLGEGCPDAAHWEHREVKSLAEQHSQDLSSLPHSVEPAPNHCPSKPSGTCLTSSLFRADLIRSEHRVTRASSWG